MHGCIASDCPHRERLPYTGDGEASAETVMLNFDAAAFYQKWIRDMRDVQNRQTGYVPNGAPWEPNCGGGVAWGAAMNIIPWQYYVQYGDRRLLEESYPAMKEQLRCMMSWLTPDGIMYQQMTNKGSDKLQYWLCLGEWCPPATLPKDQLVHTFYLWLCADYTARAAGALGKQQEQQQYQQIADRVRSAFHRNFYDAQNHTYGQAGSNIFALRMGVPEECRAQVVETLRTEIADHCKGHINTGFLATKYFFETLTDNGLDDLALTVMSQKDFPSYGWWIQQGATTTWEQWNGQNSHNHPMFGGGLTWFYRRLAGVETDESQPAYRHIVLRPTFTDDVANVRYEKQTPYGHLVSAISHQGGRCIYEVTVPVGSTATVYLPTGNTADITEGGKPLDKTTGIVIAGQTGKQTVLELQQGTYQLNFAHDLAIYRRAFSQVQEQLKYAVACADKAVKEKDNRTINRVTPKTENKEGALVMVSPNDWCSGFFAGTLWQVFDATGKEEWRERAVRYTWPIESAQYNKGTHDLGFMMNNSFGKAYQITDERSYKDVVLQSAKSLITRYNKQVGCIRSWDHNREAWKFPVIIDNMMNLEMLFRATQLTGDSTYWRIAVSHANTTLKNHFRADASSYHVIDYDPETGAVRKRNTAQGCDDESFWSRGQAWGLYGFTMAYRFTHNPAYLQQASRIADFWLSLKNMPADGIPYWDMKLPQVNADTPRDASAAAIIASALQELSSYVDAAAGARYMQAADHILQNLCEHYMPETGTHNGFLLLHSTGSKPANSEIDVPLNYADYYFVEALLRRLGK